MRAAQTPASISDWSANGCCVSICHAWTCASVQQHLPEWNMIHATLGQKQCRGVGARKEIALNPFRCARCSKFNTLAVGSRQIGPGGVCDETQLCTRGGTWTDEVRKRRAHCAVNDRATCKKAAESMPSVRRCAVGRMQRVQEHVPQCCNPASHLSVALTSDYKGPSVAHFVWRFHYCSCCFLRSRWVLHHRAWPSLLANRSSCVVTYTWSHMPHVHRSW